MENESEALFLKFWITGHCVVGKAYLLKAVFIRKEYYD